MPSELTQIDRPAQYVDALKHTLGAVLDEAINIGGYESWGAAQAYDYQVLIELGEMQPAPPHNDGRQAQIQQVILYAVVSNGIEQSALIAANLASELMRVTHDQRWGLPYTLVGEPTALEAQSSFMIEKNKAHRGFEAWELQFKQRISYGPSGWPDDVVNSNNIALATNPVDDASNDEYRDLE
jgi:hypothetical protein